MPTDAGTPEAVAMLYETTLRRVVQAREGSLPVFDLVHLGLFRIAMTVPLLNAAPFERRCVSRRASDVNDIRESAHVAFRIDDVFDLVESVENYPEVPPWCAAAMVLSRNDTEASARITVGYGDLRFDFVTRNPMRCPEFMAIHLEKGPFRRFEGEWHLSRLGVNACKIEFALRYEFENPVIAAMAGPVFGQMADTLVDAFVRRVDHVDGRHAATVQNETSTRMKQRLR